MKTVCGVYGMGFGVSRKPLVSSFPCIYFGYRLVRKEAMQSATEFAGSVRIIEGTYLLKDESIPITKRVRSPMVVAPSVISKNAITERSKNFSLDYVKLIFQEGFLFDDIRKQDRQIDKLKVQINRLNTALMKTVIIK